METYPGTTALSSAAEAVRAGAEHYRTSDADSGASLAEIQQVMSE